jgi:rare lipoprotein A
MRLRSILIASGVAVAVLAAGGWALISAGGSGGSAQAAQSAPLPTDTAQTGAPQADPPRATPSRASRGETRDPSPSPQPKSPKPKPKKSKPSYRVLSSGSCEASFYGEGQETASGETFDPSELTAAHKTLPMGSKVRVTNKNNGRSVIVRINDRGPYAGGRCLDLSTAAMEKVGGTGSGVIPVRYQVLARG